MGTTDPDLTTAVRLARLERSAARARRASLGLAVAVTGLLLMGQVLPKTRLVEGEGFVLRDVQGKVRARIGMEQDGAVVLALRSASGDERLTLSVHADGVPQVRIGDGKSRAGVELGVQTVTLTDERGDGRLSLALGGGGAPALWLNDLAGRQRVGLELRPDAQAHVLLNDPSGRARAELSVRSDGAPQLALYDETAKAIFTAPPSR